MAPPVPHITLSDVQRDMVQEIKTLRSRVTTLEEERDVLRTELRELVAQQAVPVDFSRFQTTVNQRLAAIAVRVDEQRQHILDAAEFIAYMFPETVADEETGFGAFVRQAQKGMQEEQAAAEETAAPAASDEGGEEGAETGPVEAAGSSGISLHHREAAEDEATSLARAVIDVPQAATADAVPVDALPMPSDTVESLLYEDVKTEVGDAAAAAAAPAVPSSGDAALPPPPSPSDSQTMISQDDAMSTPGRSGEEELAAAGQKVLAELREATWEDIQALNFQEARTTLKLLQVPARRGMKKADFHAALRERIEALTGETMQEA